LHFARSLPIWGETFPEIAMRIVVLGLLVLLVLLPSLLILFARHRPARIRLPMAMAAFLSPIVMIGLVSAAPYLMNDVRNAPQWAHMLGLMMWAGGFFLPWIIFALFLHMGRNTTVG
jgi:nitrate/nitrite transporter NarK